MPVNTRPGSLNVDAYERALRNYDRQMQQHAERMTEHFARVSERMAEAQRRVDQVSEQMSQSFAPLWIESFTIPVASPTTGVGSINVIVPVAATGYVEPDVEIEITPEFKAHQDKEIVSNRLARVSALFDDE